MDTVQTSSLTANSYYNEPVYLAEGYIILSPDTPISVELVNRLKSWDFNTLFSDGKLQEAPTAYDTENEDGPTTAFLDRDIKENEKSEISKRFYFTVLSYVDDQFKIFRQNNKLDMAGINQKVKDIIRMVKENRDALLSLQDFNYLQDNYLPAHCLNTTLLSLAIGEVLKLPPFKMIELGLAALLHDIGMVKIPEILYLNDKKLSPQEQKMVKAHTVLGYKILKSLSLTEEIAIAALQHHERMNSTGYPQNLSGDKISLYSKIIALTCSYEAMVTHRAYREGRDAHTALLELVKSSRTFYDESVTRVLIYCISLYPLGSLVRLSTNAVAKVVKTNPGNPKFPVVRILFDERGNKVSEYIIVQTSAEKGITIQKSLSSQEIASLG
ncbi:MAG: HD domain-containing protein [Spirochaeta sp.]|nr:HD domain-containing protein [Spirochaeta sp.]